MTPDTRITSALNDARMSRLDDQGLHDQAVWKNHARQWTRVGSPLRPGAEDAAIMKAMLEAWQRRVGRANPTVLVMGVTPEVCETVRAIGGRVVAVDRSRDMIRSTWRGNEDGCVVTCAEWRALPLAPSSVDIVVGDGVLSMLPYPDGYIATGVQLRYVLSRPGCCILRCFAQADAQESLADVASALCAEPIGNFHILKWRVAMAVQRCLSQGVAVEAVWDAVQAYWPDLEALASSRGWPLAEVETIQAYRGVPTRYTFPTLAEYRAAFSLMGFRLTAAAFPEYELGERCPTVTLTCD